MKGKTDFLVTNSFKVVSVNKLLSIFLIILFLGCDQKGGEIESEIAQKELLKSNLTSKKITIEEIPNIIEQLVGITGKNIFESSSKSKEGAIFSKKNITQVKDTLNRINYSFPFVYEDSPENVYFNLIVPLNSKGKALEPFVLRYEVKPEFLESFEKVGRPFEEFNGEVSLFYYKDFFNEKKPYGKYVCETRHDQYGDPIPCDIVTLPYGGTGGPAGTGGADSGPPSSPGGVGGQGSGEGQCTWYTESTCWCDGDLVGSHNHSEPALVIDCSDSGVSKSSKGGCDECYSSGSSGVTLYPKSVLKLDYYFNAIGYDLNTDQLNFLYNYSIVAKNINQYLLSKGRTAANLEFAKEALETIISGEGRVNILAGIINLISVKCAADAVQEASNKDAGLTQTIYEIFGTDNEADYNIIYNDIPFPFNPNGLVAASTEPVLNGSGDLTGVEITFNYNYLVSASDVDIFKTVIHENLHAIMFHQLNVSDVDIDSSNGEFAALAEEWSEYVAQRITGGSSDISTINWLQHQIITDLVENMAALLKEFAVSKGYTIDDETAIAICWGGLQETTAWAGLNNVDKIVYDNIINTERNGANDSNAVGQECF